MLAQDALTISAKIAPLRESQVRQVLEEMTINPGSNSVLPFGAIPGCHFGRVVLLPTMSGPTGDRLGPELLMLSDCDGPADQHLQVLVDVAGAGIDRLFGSCEGYPQGAVGRSERIAFLERKRLRTRANYVHQQGRTVEQIKLEEELRKELQAFVATQRFASQPAVEVRKQILAHLKLHPRLAAALEAVPGPGLAFKVREALHLVLPPAALITFCPVVLPTALCLLLLVRLQESRDYVEHIRPTAERIKELTELEDWTANSGYTAGAFVKPGWVRQTVVSSLLQVIGWGTRHLFTRASLAGVKTIHFARWIPLGGGRVVFCSNYDGSVESYNNDFIDLVAAGLNLIFSNAYGYPRTEWLIKGGATREQEFKDFLRNVQIPTPVWHSAYSELTAANVDRNAKLRAGLHGRMTEAEAQAWLRLI